MAEFSVERLWVSRRLDERLLAPQRQFEADFASSWRPETAATGIPLAFIIDSSNATVFGKASAPPRTPPAPRATSSGVRPAASFAVRSAPLATRNSMYLSKPCSAAPWSAVWFGIAFALGIWLPRRNEFAIRSPTLSPAP